MSCWLGWPSMSFGSPDDWDQAMQRDSQPGGRLQDVIDLARTLPPAGRSPSMKSRRLCFSITFKRLGRLLC